MNSDPNVLEMNGKTYRRGPEGMPFFYPEEDGEHIYCACSSKSFQLFRIRANIAGFANAGLLEAKCRSCGLRGRVW